MRKWQKKSYRKYKFFSGNLNAPPKAAADKTQSEKTTPQKFHSANPIFTHTDRRKSSMLARQRLRRLSG
ncbi:MAG: hypothetical protein DBX55_00395 [Verrucomicrobia bacterium]|nr:MAG: hypothetical protein DBX55_00395 [Verrucomicrobiota bacterium]